MKLIHLVVALSATLPLQARADPRFDVLIAAYPEHLASYRGDELIWKDGSRMPLGSAATRRPFVEMLEHGTIREQFAIPYPLATAPLQPPALDEDPGRIRDEAFFLRMYGDCRKGEVAAKMRAVAWLPRHGGGTVRATTVNGVADQLEKASRELDELPESMIGYLIPMSGIYNCRPIAGTNRLSVHAYGAAVDINARFGDYWQWAKRPMAQLRGATGFHGRSSRYSNATASSGAAAGTISIACISSTAPS